MAGERNKRIDFGDVQGLMRFGHGHLAHSCLLLLRLEDAQAARRWLLRAPVNTAEMREEPPVRVLQVAFTAAGLRALELPDTILAGFSQEFISGMAGDGNRSRRLGDTGRNHPDDWRWGDADAEHVLLMAYTHEGDMAAWRGELEDQDYRQAFAELQSLEAVKNTSREPFGFEDGISQPDVDWLGKVRTGPHERDRYSNVLALGEVLLGYRNEYGLYTSRPLLRAGEYAGADSLSVAEDDQSLRDLGRNGSYLVLRQLSQDVQAFHEYLDRICAGDLERREQLAAAMVGRQPDGKPLVPSLGLNQFHYDDDPFGQQCPIGSHVRRTNPRTGDLPPGVNGLLDRLIRMLGFHRRHPRDDLVASSRFHRLLRRGRAYGPDGSGEQGLHFICLGANISRQFEFVQNAWCASSKFAGLEAEADPLLGNREPLPGGTATDRFTMPQANAPAQCLRDLPQFVQVRGGAYFFMPGLRALRFIAGDG